MTRYSKDDRKTFVENREKELLQNIQAGVAAIRTSDDWQNWLKVSALFWRYSFYNQMLIWCQRPDATHVAGFRKWKELGRTVKKGEKALWILAPMKKVVATDKENGEKVYGIRGFRGVSVFDKSQTEGKALPESNFSITAQGEAPAQLILLTRVAEHFGFSVEVTDTGGANGYVNTSKEIKLRQGNGTLAQAKTLIHEIAHGILGHPGNGAITREMKELQAETTAYVVSQALGLETEKESFNYLTAWSADDKDFAARLQEAANVAMGAAKKILEAIEALEGQAQGEDEIQEAA